MSVLNDYGNYWRLFYQSQQESEVIDFETTLENSIALFSYFDEYIKLLKDKMAATDSTINVLYLVFGIGTILLVALHTALLWLSYRRSAKQTYHMTNLVLKIEKKATEDWLRKFQRLLDSLNLLAGLNKQRLKELSPAMVQDDQQKNQKNPLLSKDKHKGQQSSTKVYTSFQNIESVSTVNYSLVVVLLGLLLNIPFVFDVLVSRQQMGRWKETHEISVVSAEIASYLAVTTGLLYKQAAQVFQ